MTNRFPLRALTLAIAGVFALSACGSSSPSASVAPSGSVAAGTAANPNPSPSQVAVGKPLELPVLTSTTFVRNFNPFSGGNPVQTKGTIYEPLYIVNAVRSGEETPWLATSYAWSGDLKTLTFTIRDGVKWSDGLPLTANDVVFTFMLGKDKPALDQSGFWGGLQGTSAELVGTNQVKLTFKTVDVTRFAQLVNNTWIYPEHIWSQQADPTNWENPDPVGSGPFTKIENFALQSYTLAKNPYYWRNDVAIPALNYTQYASQDAIMQALKDNQADWAGAVVPDIEKTFVAADPVHNHYDYSAPSGALQLCLNTTKKPFDDPAFRKALSLSINRSAITNNAVYGFAPASTATGLGGAWPDLDLALKDLTNNALAQYDIAASKTALDAAGYPLKDGKRLDKQGNSISIKIPVTSSWFDWVSTAQIIADGFNQLGIAAKVDPLPEFGTWFDQVTKGSFDVAECWPSVGSPYAYYYGFFSGDLKTPVGQAAPQETWGRWSDPALDAIFHVYQTTTNKAEQGQLVQQMERIFLDNMPGIPLVYGPYWQIFTTHNYVGWSQKSNYYSTGFDPPYDLLMFINLKPAPQG